MQINDEHDLLLHWFTDIGNKEQLYKEPLLDNSTVMLFKQICDILGQSSHVFIMSVEMAENYINAKNQQDEKIQNPILASATIAFICHKWEGGLESLKVQHIVDLLFHFTDTLYTFGDVLNMESDILRTLEGKLPNFTPMDDMDIIIEKYMKEGHFKANVRPLCVKILEFLYIEKNRWFWDLKDIYSDNYDCVVVFKNLISSRFYLPVSVFISALLLCNYRYSINIDDIFVDLTQQTRIHMDHFGIFIWKIVDMVGEN